jgi:hypothetical protein
MNPMNHPTTDSILVEINDFAPQGAFLLIVDSDLHVDSAQQPVTMCQFTNRHTILT